MKDIVLKFRTNIIFSILCLCGLCLPAIQSLAFLKSLPEDQPIRSGYLSFQSPPKLLYHEITPTADRRKLLYLAEKNLLPTEIKPVAVSPNDEAFPLVNYNEDSNNSIPVYNIPLKKEETLQIPSEDALPPVDPFLPVDSAGPSLNNTDELIQILESNSKSPSRSINSRVEFVPPYTIDGGNMIMESKSKYERRVRN